MSIGHGLLSGPESHMTCTVMIPNSDGLQIFSCVNRSLAKQLWKSDKNGPFLHVWQSAHGYAFQSWFLQQSGGTSSFHDGLMFKVTHVLVFWAFSYLNTAYDWQGHCRHRGLPWDQT
jgi:hypothetical protein